MPKRIIFTVDTEAFPGNFPNNPISRLIHARLADEDYGIGRMFEIADRHGIRMTCFVEYGSNDMHGRDWLNVPRYIQKRGHDVQLHLHCECFAEATRRAFGFNANWSMFDASQVQADGFVKLVIDRHLEACGSKPVAWRGGGYRYNGNIIRSLDKYGIKYDFSYNPGRLNQPFNQGPLPPFIWKGTNVTEVPITCITGFNGYKGHVELNFNDYHFTSHDSDKVINNYELFLEQYFNQYPNGIAVIVMHSWSFLQRTNKIFDAANPQAPEIFDSLCGLANKKYDVITAAQLAESDFRAEREIEYRVNFFALPPAAKSVCPVCGSTEFANVGSSVNRACKKCNSLESQRALALLLAAKRDVLTLSGKKVLLLTNSRPEVRLLKEYGADLTTLDIRPIVALDILADVTNMKEVPSARFDLVLACQFLTHVHDLPEALAEIARVLRPDGILLQNDFMSSACLTKHKTDLAEITSEYGQENYEKYRIGGLRRFGELDIDNVFLPHFERDYYKIVDPVTNSIEIWNIWRKISYVRRHGWQVALSCRSNAFAFLPVSIKSDHFAKRNLDTQETMGLNFMAQAKSCTISKQAAKCEASDSSAIPGMLASLANTFKAQKNYAAAIKIWMQIRNSFPEYAPAWGIPSLLLLEEGKIEDAEKLACDGIDIKPQLLDPWFAWAQVAAHQKNFREAAVRWGKVRQLFPTHPHGYGHGAIAALELGRLEEAKHLCQMAIARGADKSQMEFLTLRLAMSHNDYANAAVLGKKAVLSQSASVQTFLDTSYALCELKRYPEAEAICLMGMNNGRYQAEMLVELAEIASRKGEPMTSLARWRVLRKLHPEYLRGYVKPAQILLDLDKDADAMELYLAARKKGYFIKNKLTLPTNFADFIAREAFKSAEAFNYGRSLALYGLLGDLYPHDARAFLGQADALMENRQYAKARTLYEQAAKFPEYNGLAMRGVVEILVHEGQYANAANLLEILLEQESYPGTIWDEPSMPVCLNMGFRMERRVSHLPEAHSKSWWQLWAVKCFLMIGESGIAGKALDYLEQKIGVTATTLEWRLQIARTLEPAQAAAEIEKYVSKMLALPETGEPSSQNFIKLMRLLLELADAGQANLHRLLFAEACKKYEPVKIKYRFPKKLAAWVRPTRLPYIESVLRCFAPGEIDITLCHMENITLDTVREQYQFDGLTITDAPEAYKDYEYLFLEGGLRPPQKLPGQKYIAFAHASDAPDDLVWSRKFEARILSCSKLCSGESVKPYKTETLLLAALESTSKCEIAYSGPYHADRFFEAGKEHIRKQILNKHPELDFSRPVLYFVEDEVCLPGQIIYCLNKLSQFFTVIFRPESMRKETNIQKKISSRVFVTDRFDSDHNLYRFGSDFVFASFYSGSAISALMLGLNLVCYYSRYCKGDKPTSLFGNNYIAQYDKFFMPSHPNDMTGIPIAHTSKIFVNLLKNDDMLFDLLDIAKIKTAIEEDIISTYYHNKLSILRKQVFGDYFIDGSANRTAELIKNFSLNGTFGTNCASVYFKPPIKV